MIAHRHPRRYESLRNACTQPFMRANLCALTRIRRASVDDTEAIAAYHHRCWAIAFSGLLAPGMVEQMDPSGKIERWRAWLARDSGYVTTVADESGTPIGHTTVARNKLVHLFVNPDYWRQGIGLELLGVGEGLLRDAGHREVELCTRIGNEPAIALYLKCGWRVTDRVVHYEEDGVVYDEHVLTKHLD
jgi:RimJ/RimL family protein N-acetyltransferase